MEIPRKSTLLELEGLVKQAYPDQPLELVGFKFGRFKKGGYRPVVEALSPDSLKDLIKIVKQARLLIIPLRPLILVRTIDVNRFFVFFSDV